MASSSQSDSQTTNRSINAQDSLVASEGSLIANNAWVVGEGGVLQITDGGAFELVGNVVKVGADLIENIFTKSTNTLANGMQSVLAANQAQSQEAALTAQQSTNKLIGFTLATAAVVAVVYIWKK